MSLTAGQALSHICKLRGVAAILHPVFVPSSTSVNFKGAKSPPIVKDTHPDSRMCDWAIKHFSVVCYNTEVTRKHLHGV